MFLRSLTRTGLALLGKTPLAKQPLFCFSQYNRYNDPNTNTNAYMEEQMRTSHVVANNVGLSKFLNRYLSSNPELCSPLASDSLEPWRLVI